MDLYDYMTNSFFENSKRFLSGQYEDECDMDDIFNPRYIQQSSKVERDKQIFLNKKDDDTKE